MQLFNSNSFVKHRKMCYMQDITVHMWLPIKSHADWQHYFSHQKKGHGFCGRCFVYRTSLTGHVSVASCSTFNKSELIIYKLRKTFLIYDVQWWKENTETLLLPYCGSNESCMLLNFPYNIGGVTQIYKYLLERCCCDMLICNVFFKKKPVCTEVLSLGSRGSYLKELMNCLGWICKE